MWKRVSATQSFRKIREWMNEQDTFRRRVMALYRRSSPYDDGRRPTQADLAEAIGLSRAELTKRLNGSMGKRLTERDVRDIVRTLVEWGAITSQAEARELLVLMRCTPFTAAEWQSPPLDMLTPLNPSSEPPPPAAPHRSLPQFLSSFIGRERDLAALEQRIEQHRLVTLTGAGGSGKTRLAIAAAQRLLGRYAAGVQVVALAALTEPPLLPYVVARTLGFATQSKQEIGDVLVAGIGEGELLLVLDNCEHLLEPVAALVTQLLRGCPHLHILATSRARLQAEGEALMSVPPLILPPPGQITAAELADYEATRLFMARAELVNPDFSPDDDQAVTVRTICARLDGLPLAIELAAARTRMMSVAEIAMQLDKGIRLLTAGPRTAPARQATITASIQWSFDLLTSREQRLLCQLSVFSDGWSLQAAERVLGDEYTAENIIGLHESLLDKSLLVADTSAPDTRFRMLETIRQFAAEKLDEVELTQLRRHHLDWYLAHTEQAATELSGPMQTEWATKLEADYPNLRAALSFATNTPGLSEAGLRLCIALGHFWVLHSHAREGLRWMEPLLASAEITDQPLRARGFQVASTLASDSYDHKREYELLAKGLELYRQLDDNAGITLALAGLGRVAALNDDYITATPLLNEALARARALDNPNTVIYILANIATVKHCQGHYQEAKAMLAQAMARCEEVVNIRYLAHLRFRMGETLLAEGNSTEAERYFLAAQELADQMGMALFIPYLLYSRGQVAELEDDYAWANSLYLEAEQLAKQREDRVVISLIYSGLGNIAQHEGDYARAITLKQEALRVNWAQGYRRDVAIGVEELAQLAAQVGDYCRAARLLGAASALRAMLIAPIPPIGRAAHQRCVSLVRKGLGDAESARLRGEGGGLNMEQAYNYALDNILPPTPADEHLVSAQQ